MSRAPRRVKRHGAATAETEAGGAPDGAALQAYMRLLRATDSVLACVAPGIAAAGLTMTQFGALEALYHLGPLSQAEIGRKILRSAGNMTLVLDNLEREGLIERCPEPGDRRARRVSLTPAGRARVAAILPAHRADIARAMAALSARELKALCDLLLRLGMGALEMRGRAA